MTRARPEDCRTVDELRAAVAAGARPRYVLFWGHRPAVPGRVDESCLSNWYPAPFEVDGVRYPTSEHFMMAAKARLFGDGEALARIVAAGSPGKAKAIGRQVRGFRQEAWTAHRFGIVVQANVAKFGQNGELRRLLLRTGSKVLVEASPQDRIWGIGMGRAHPHVSDPAAWPGLNLLGFALMEARTRLTA